MNAAHTATQIAARYSLKATEAASLATVCYQAAAEMPHDLSTNDEKKNARFAFTLAGHNAHREAREARNQVVGMAHFPKATPATIHYAEAAQLVVEEATQLRDELMAADREASLTWRREQRLRNTDGSFALTPLEKEEAAARGY